MTLLAAALALAVQAGQPATAPVPLLRDPVHDGAADASTVWDPATRQWRMFYTNRRATLPLADPKDVRWVHGTHIGMAHSADGLNWRYAGIAAIPEHCTGPTLWAPEIQRIDGQWHLWLTVVPGVFGNWNAPRRIVHLTSPDLDRWTCAGPVDLGSDRVIDASVVTLPGGGYRMWFNDERRGKAIVAADSDDLIRWRVGKVVVDTPGEGPKVFRWRGRWWMVSDAWKGLLVLSSPDADSWTRQPGYLLAEPGTRPTDRAKGQHPDIVVSGDRAFIIWFVHQSGEPEAAGDPAWQRRSVLQIGELTERDGVLSIDRNASVAGALQPPAS